MILKKEWFKRYQKQLLFFANLGIGRCFFRIHGKRSSVGKRQIIKISPNSITWINGFKDGRPELAIEFRSNEKFSLRLYHGLYPLWWLLHQWDTLIANNFFPQWNLGFDSLTFYPDANPESTSVDGAANMSYAPGSGIAWGTIRSAAGNGFNDSATSNRAGSFVSDTVSDGWFSIYRGIFLFDTSALHDGAVITSSVFSLYGRTLVDQLSVTPNLNVYSSNPASNTALTGTDYATLGSTAFCDTAIAYASLTTAGYNNFSLNASGLAAISKTGVSKFGTRNANYDVANIAPTWSSFKESGITVWNADQTGTTNDPKLVVTFDKFANITKPSTSYSGVTKPATSYTDIQASAFKLLINATDFLLINSTDKLLINKPGTGIDYTNITKPS